MVNFYLDSTIYRSGNLDRPLQLPLLVHKWLLLQIDQQDDNVQNNIDFYFHYQTQVRVVFIYRLMSTGILGFLDFAVTAMLRLLAKNPIC